MNSSVKRISSQCHLMTRTEIKPKLCGGARQPVPTDLIKNIKNHGCRTIIFRTVQNHLPCPLPATSTQPTTHHCHVRARPWVYCYVTAPPAHPNVVMQHAKDSGDQLCFGHTIESEWLARYIRTVLIWKSLRMTLETLHTTTYILTKNNNNIIAALHLSVSYFGIA